MNSHDIISREIELVIYFHCNFNFHSVKLHCYLIFSSNQSTTKLTEKSTFFRQINVFTKEMISRKFLSAIAFFLHFRDNNVLTKEITNELI